MIVSQPVLFAAPAPPVAPGSPEAISASRLALRRSIWEAAPGLSGDQLAVIEGACARMAEEIARPQYRGSRAAARTA